MMLSPRVLRAVAFDLLQLALYGHVADPRPLPAEPVDDRPGRSVHRYRAPEGVVPAGPPVLFVPPPAAPARCYDRCRGCGLAEHVVRAGRRSYLLGYGTARHGGRDQGLQEWVGDVLPGAIRAVSRDAGGQPVQLVGWCLGGILALLAAAAGPGLPIASVAVIAAPVDAAAARFAAAPPNRGFAGLDVLRPYTIVTNFDTVDFWARIVAADHFSDALIGYPGAAARRIYRSLFKDDALMRGGVDIGGRRVDLATVGVPVLAIAGRADALAPVRAVRPLVGLLAGAPQVRFESAPGGHLGVLAGRSARTTTWRHLDRWLDEGTVRHGIRPQRTIVPV